MPSIPYIIAGGAFSLISAYITWLSWKDTRKLYKMLADFDMRLSSLENSIKDTSDKPLHS